MNSMDNEASFEGWEDKIDEKDHLTTIDPNNE